MATASPSMVARTVVVLPRSSTLARAKIEVTAMPTPTSAVASGSPAAIREPKVITRTTAAIATPMISPAPRCNFSRTASPPASTVSPPCRASSAISNTWSAIESSSSNAGSLYDTWM